MEIPRRRLEGEPVQVLRRKGAGVEAGVGAERTTDDDATDRTAGAADELIVAGGAVKVDGKQELRKTAKIRAGQVVSLGDVSIQVQAG